jgi:hypothetical protein
MKLPTIDWTHVTRFSQIIAIILFVAVFALGFCIGRIYEFRYQVNLIRTGLEKASAQGSTTPILE